MSKLTQEMISEIKDMRKKGIAIINIATKFNVHENTIWYHLSEKYKRSIKRNTRKYWNQLTPKQKRKKTKKYQPILSKYIMERYNKEPEFKRKFLDRVLKYQRKRRKIWEEKGLCGKCGKDKKNKEYKWCKKCRIRWC